MAVFADTSGLYAVLTSADAHHEEAQSAWTAFAARGETLVTTNYVLVETMTLLGRRHGFQPVREFQADFVPVLDVHWVDTALHERAVAALLTAGLRDLSIVDCVSFELMRQLRLDTAFVFDEHFVQQEFRRIP